MCVAAFYMFVGYQILDMQHSHSSQLDENDLFADKGMPYFVVEMHALFFSYKYWQYLADFFF